MENPLPNYFSVFLKLLEMSSITWVENVLLIFFWCLIFLQVISELHWIV